MRLLPGIILSVAAAVSFNCGDACASERKQDIKELLNAPSVVEKFKKTQGKRTKTTKDKESPLVKEAKSFALYLNPPQKVEKRPSKINKITKSIVKKPTNVSAKFKIVGTSCSESDPSKSLALLDIAGKGLRWIRQGEKVGHLVIQEVKPGGTIVVRDGKNTSEMTVERPVKPSLLKGQAPDVQAIVGQTKTTSSKSKTSQRAAKPTLSPEQMKQQEMQMKQLLDQAGQMAKNTDKASDSSDIAEQQKNRGIPEEVIRQQELMSKQLLAQMDKMLKNPDNKAGFPKKPDEKPAPPKEVEVEKKPEVEKRKDETPDVKTLEDASGLMDKLSEKLEQVKSDTDTDSKEKTQKSIQQDAEYLRKAVLKLKTADEISAEDKAKLKSLDKQLSKIQQDIRRSQSRKRIESIRSKSRR